MRVDSWVKDDDRHRPVEHRCLLLERLSGFPRLRELKKKFVLRNATLGLHYYLYLFIVPLQFNAERTRILGRDS
jgi:hypothetical protein